MSEQRFDHVKDWKQPVWHGFLNDAEIASINAGASFEEVLAGLEMTKEVRVLCEEAMENYRFEEDLRKNPFRLGPHSRRGQLENVVAQRVRRWQLEQARCVE